jgi:hypothetical protein
VSQYTDARSRPGAKLAAGTDDRELFLVEFGDMVLEAWEESNTYESLTFKKYISSGKADSFPIIGRKRDATEHTPGEIILGGSIEHNEVQITLDKMLVDAVFIAEVDELMAHYEIARPYARQLGESLSTTYDQRVAIMHVLASRVTAEPYAGGPVPSYAFHASMASDVEQLDGAAWAAVQYIKERDIGGGPLTYMLRWQQYLLMARYYGWQGGQPGAAAPVFNLEGRTTGEPGKRAGLSLKASNHIPSTNITTGNAKFQGDFTPTVGHISNEMAVGTLNRRGMKVVMKEQEDRLGTLLIASRFCGHGILRPECSFEVRTTSR